MESFLNRYRNITVLLLVIFAQLVLLAVQVKNDRDVRMVRVWTVTAVTPVARVVDALRDGSTGIVRNYFMLHDTNDENRRLKSEVDRLKVENVFLKNELNTADRAKALQLFQAHTASKTVAARVIMAGAGSNSKTVFVDRGSLSGVQRGMAVITPDGIVGKVTAAYPATSEVLLITDPDFAAGVISQKNQVRGTLKGQGNPMCKVDYVPYEEKVDPGEWFYTSGDDRIFPRGFPVGVVKAARNGQPYKDIVIEPSGLRRGLEDVLILVQGVHQEIPDVPVADQPVYIAPPPPQAPAAAANPAATAAPTQPQAGGTEADKLRTLYKSAADAQGYKFGESGPRSKPPDFTKLGQTPPPVAKPVQPGATGTAGQPASGQPAPKQPSTQPGAVTPPSARPATAGQPAVKPPAQPAIRQTPQSAAPPGAQTPDASRRANPAAGAPAGSDPSGQTGGALRK